MLSKNKTDDGFFVVGAGVGKPLKVWNGGLVKKK